jgi:glycosyltransferase involved in cell wall biosynthesis
MIPVLFIAYHFPPIGGAGVQRSQKFVRYLPAQGFEPIVVTGPGASDDRWSPSDKASEDGFAGKIYRAAGPIPQDKNRWNARLRNWLGFTPSFSRWWIQAAAKAVPRSLDGAKLIFATMSPFSTAVVAQQLSQAAGIPWIADLRDPWALDEMQIYPSGIHRRLELKRMERLLSGAAGIIMNTPEAAAALRTALPSLAGKPVVTITNGFDAADFNGEATLRTDAKFRLVHTGYLHTELGLKLQKKRRLHEALGGMEPGIDILTRSHIYLLKAVELWIAGRPEVAQDLEIIFAGVTSTEDKAVVANSALARFIRFTGYVSHAESVGLIRTADLLFLPMHNLPMGRRSRIVPGKTYEYMAAARPILAAVPEGDARDFLQKLENAFLCKPDDVPGLVQGLDRVYSTWKSGRPVTNTNRDFTNNFDRLKLTGDLARFFNQVLELTEY